VVFLFAYPDSDRVIILMFCCGSSCQIALVTWYTTVCLAAVCARPRDQRAGESTEQSSLDSVSLPLPLVPL